MHKTRAATTIEEHSAALRRQSRRELGRGRTKRSRPYMDEISSRIRSSLDSRSLKLELGASGGNELRPGGSGALPRAGVAGRAGDLFVCARIAVSSDLRSPTTLSSLFRWTGGGGGSDLPLGPVVAKRAPALPISLMISVGAAPTTAPAVLLP
jgi:hypothetical protein